VAARLSGSYKPFLHHVTSGRPIATALLTGWHEPRASHLALLEAVAGRALLERSYAAALAEGYRWHEFGDLHLVLP
jgi:S-adenosylmethionine:tRNA ribosyltransferase-isomerase